MTEQSARQIQELNRTPLSQKCRGLVKHPSESGLYLLQALMEAQEENAPDWTSSDRSELRAQSAHRAMTEILETLEWRYSPKRAYQLLTTNTNLEEDEMNDGELLRMLDGEENPEEQRWILLDNATDNLQSYGFNPSGR